MIDKVICFAKINLFLYVTGKRDDGFHNLYSLMTQIDLHDELFFDYQSTDIRVVCSHPEVPEDSSNLAYRAAELFFNETGIQGQGLCMTIQKHIPIGGGLGGGSSNAAAVLKQLNHHHGKPLSIIRLKQLGRKLGADVPFFIEGVPAVAKGIGEILEPVEKLPKRYLVLCDPGVASVTAQVYKNIDFRLTENQKYNMNTGLNVPIRGQVFDGSDALHNDLEDPACRLYPKIEQTKEEMALLLERNVYMTGSGSSLFALYPDRKAAEVGFERLKKHWDRPEKKVYLSSFI